MAGKTVSISRPAGKTSASKSNAPTHTMAHRASRGTTDIGDPDGPKKGK